MDVFTVALIIIGCGILYLYLTKNINYWRDRDVPYAPPLPVLGNLKPLIFMQKAPGPFLGSLYSCVHALGQRFLGIHLLGCEPALLIRDPDLIKRILVQDFEYFHNRNVDCHASCDPIGIKNLFVVRGAKWKYLRTRLTPTFTTGKLKQMFLLIKDVMSDLNKVIAESANSTVEEPTPLECKELIGQYTTDVINSCAFGIRSNSLNDPNSQFRYFGRKVFNTGIKRSLETRSFFFMPSLAKTFRFVFFEKESSKFMADVFSEILTEREKSAMSRNDFVDVLIKLKKDLEELKHDQNALEELRELDDDSSVVAQAALFYTAGFETTSETIMTTLYELSLQPAIQDRLRREILEAIEGNEANLNYETLSQMKYLDMVVSETLRKYPPMPFLDRICVKNYKIPESDVIIKKGTPIYISLYKGLHYDERYFPNPEKYDPERFNDERKTKIEPYSYLPFGEGPHICLGMRFGVLNVKTTLALILCRFKVQTCEKTPIPMEVSKRSIILSPRNDLYLAFSPLSAENGM